MKHIILTICAFMMLSVLCPDAMAKSKKEASAKNEKTSSEKFTYNGPKVENLKDHEVTLKGIFNVDLSGGLLFQPDKTERIEGRKLWGIRINSKHINQCKNLPEGEPKDWNKKAMKINARVSMVYARSGEVKFSGLKELKSLELIEKEKPTKEE